MPRSILQLLGYFAPLFSTPTWKNILVLVRAHLMSRGRRTFTDLLRLAGHKDDGNFSRFHRVFSQGKWSAYKVAKTLLERLIVSFSSGKGLVFIIDETLERRKGPMIQGLGSHRDAVRSTKDRKAFSIGISWLVTALRIRVPWSGRFAALPFLTILMPSKRVLTSSRNPKDVAGKRKYKTYTRWTEQVIYTLRRWLKNVKFTVVADSAFATYSICRTCIRHNATLVSRLRLDAKLFDYPPPTKEGRGRPRKVGKRQTSLKERATNRTEPWKKMTVSWYGGKKAQVTVLSGVSLWYDYSSKNFPIPVKWVLIKDVHCHNKPVVLFATDVDLSVEELIGLYVSRWTLETTFEETRRHLGMETHRNWADKSIARLTPSILASYSFTWLAAAALVGERDTIQPQQTAWYQKDSVTFADAADLVRREIIRESFFSARVPGCKRRKIPSMLQAFWAMAG